MLTPHTAEPQNTHKVSSSSSRPSLGTQIVTFNSCRFQIGARSHAQDEPHHVAHIEFLCPFPYDPLPLDPWEPRGWLRGRGVPSDIRLRDSAAATPEAVPHPVPKSNGLPAGGSASPDVDPGSSHSSGQTQRDTEKKGTDGIGQRPGSPREVSLGRQMPRSPRSPNPVALSVLGTASRCLRAADYFFWAGPRPRGPEVPLQRPRPLPPLLQGLPEAGSLPRDRRVPVRPGRSAEHSWSRLHGAARSACCCLAATRRPRPCAVPRCLAGEPTPATQPSTSFCPQLPTPSRAPQP